VVDICQSPQNKEGKLKKIVGQLLFVMFLGTFGIWLNSLKKHDMENEEKGIGTKKDYSVDAGILNVRLTTIDSCEYFKMQASVGNKVIVHKGNCKHCRAWQTKIIDSILESKMSKKEQ
jgi:hypothetical protein